MKKVIDTIKEIITKDASTQTEPVTIVENEEDMKVIQTEGQQIIGIKTKRDEYYVDIRKAKSNELVKQHRKKIAENPEEALKYLSGQDHVKEIIKEEIDAEQEEPQNKTDASFYDKCVRYIEQIYPKELDLSNFYSGVSGTLIVPINEERYPINVEQFNNLIKHLLKDVTYTDYYTDEERKNKFVIQTAGIYAVCIDSIEAIRGFMQKNNERNINESDLSNIIFRDLAEVAGQDLAGEVFDILDNTN